MAFELSIDFFPSASGWRSGDDKAEEWGDSTTEYADVVGAKSQRSSLPSGKARGSRHTGPTDSQSSSWPPPPDPREVAPLPSLEGLQIVPDFDKRDVFINQVPITRV